MGIHSQPSKVLKRVQAPRDDQYSQRFNAPGSEPVPFFNGLLGQVWRGDVWLRSG
jgi:hypothetical protein